ncbi:MAG: RNA 2',3'-cyclic phosphodiesterase [Burkholderiaceae bacterium]
MTMQLPLAGIDAIPSHAHRLFFALYPDADAAAHIERVARHLRSTHRLRGSPLAAERFHVTLHFLGDYLGVPRNIVAAADEAAATVVTPPFEVSFDRASSFGRSRNLPFVLRASDDVAALMSFHGTLGTAMTKAGLGRYVNAVYTPHVTLLYDDRCVAEEPVDAIAWTVREFVLIDSLIGQGRHVPLARWPLRDLAPC